MGISKVDAPQPSPRLIPSLVNADEAVLARESTSHAEAIARLESQAGRLATLTGRYLGRQIITLSGTYTPAPGATMARVRGIGGGGAGGGATAVGVGVGAGAGGSSGVMFDLVLGTRGVPLTGGAYACGAGGTPVSGGPGGAGGDSTIVVNGVTYVAKGGAGGALGASTLTDAIAMANTPAAGTSGGGVVTFGPGANGLVVGGAAWSSGSGGSTELGPGGLGVGGSTPGLAGSSYGGGGGGGAAQTVNRAGGAGGAAAFVIDEYS